MVDSGVHHHRPRTTRELRHRVEAAAREAGADVDGYHEAIQVATAYLELAAGINPPCPVCDRDTLAKVDGNERLTCKGEHCGANPMWQLVVGVDRDTDLPNPIEPADTPSFEHLNGF